MLTNPPEDQRSNPYRPPLSSSLVPAQKKRSPERTENNLQFGFVLVASQTFGMLIGDGLQRFQRYLPDIPRPFVCGLLICIPSCLTWLYVKWKNPKIVRESHPDDHSAELN